MNPSETAGKFIEVFDIAALQAGAVAMRLRGEVHPRQKHGGTPEAEAVTSVDFAAQDVLLHPLARAFPKAGLDAEEKTDTVALFDPALPGELILVIDPIDGSLNYIRQEGAYAVMGACLLDNFYLAGLVHFPVEDTTYWAIRGEGCWVRKGGEPPRRATLQETSPRVLVTPAVPDVWRRRLEENGFDPVLSRCSAVDATAPLNGRAQASVCACRSDRRRAIGYLLTLEAGGKVRLGERAWRGEDPESSPFQEGPSLVAPSEESLSRIASLLKPAETI